MNRILWTLALAACAPPTLSFDTPSGDRLWVQPNVDDDDGNGKRDWKRAPTEDDERAVVVVPRSALRGGGLVVLGLEGDVDDARVWHEGDVVLEGTDDRWEVPRASGDLEVAVELAEPGVSATLTLTRTKGRSTSLATLQVRAAPLTLAHHLQPVEHVWLMDVDDGPFYDNQDMVSTYAGVLGDAVTFVDQETYLWDVWVQDEMQLGHTATPDEVRPFVLDSLRDRELAPLPANMIGPDQPVLQVGRGEANTYDSFGNLEVSPPVTVDGVSYPLGRIYYGWDGGSEGPVPALRSFLNEQTAQAPFALDTSWLCIGHVDEFVTFIPAPDTPKGFVVGFADPDAAWSILDELDPDTALPRYARRGIDLGHNRPTVGSLAGDTALRAFNDDVRDRHLLPIKETLKAELGLDDEDFLSFPIVFEESFDCGDLAIALTPGTVNLVVAERPDGTHLFIPDPFVRDSDTTAGRDRDPFIAAITAALPEGLIPHFVDNWFVYHMAWGEVHCGTNERRTPDPDLFSHLDAAWTEEE